MLRIKGSWRIEYETKSGKLKSLLIPNKVINNNLYKIVQLIARPNIASTTLITSGGLSTAIYSKSNYGYYDLGYNLNGGLDEVLLGLGSGTTPATPEDYTLESPIATLNPSEVYYELNTPTHSKQVYSGSYYTDTDIQISELAFYGKWHHYTGTTHKYYWYMLDRTNLDQPISVAAGRRVSIAFIYEIILGE